MKKYECLICGYVYDEAQGIPDAGIAPGTSWENLSDDWVCPICGATKGEFKVVGEPDTAEQRRTASVMEVSAEFQELTPLEVSALCSNLARGCEKQYKREEAVLFTELAEYFRSVAAPAEDPSFEKLAALVERDLEENFPYANETASADKDRGAMRALVWSEKVTRILNSLLTRYKEEGDAMLQNTGIYVCTICGFVFVGDKLPEVCPVCKVPNWKFEEA